ncbi:MAG: nucleotidyltransferase family protein [Candidatus Woesearchaeota archaeon]
MKIKTAVLLVGGLGTRLRPITYEIPKALIPVHGKPVTEHLLDLFRKYEVNNIILCVGHMKEKIKDYFRDGSQFGISIDYVDEDEGLGTAGPLKLGCRILPDRFNGTIIVSNGDELKDIDLEKMYNLHKKNNALATIALTEVEDPSRYGAARMEGSRILEFVEKPGKGKAPSSLVNAGLYIIEPEVIKGIKGDVSMLETDVFPKLAEQGKLYGYHFKGQWFDIGNMERYEDAIKNWEGIRE